MKYLPPANTTGLKIWKVGLREPVIALDWNTYVFEVIKSELLYLDLSSDKQLLDPSFFSGGSDKSVAMPMIKKGGKKELHSLGWVQYI